MIRFTESGKKYADTIISALRKAEQSVAAEIGVARMKQLNENMALFVKLFSNAGGIKNNETDPFEMIGCSCLGAYFKNASGVHTLAVSTHVGMFQDSVLCTDAGIVDFRYFPDNAGLPVIKTYHASANINVILVKNRGCVDISLNNIVCKAKSVTRLEKGCFSEEKLLSPDAYDGKRMLSGWMGE